MNAQRVTKHLVMNEQAEGAEPLHPGNDRIDTDQEHWMLGCQAAPIPPDDTSRIIGTRELSAPEVEQARHDIALVTAVAPIKPYAVVAESLEALRRVIYRSGQPA